MQSFLSGEKIFMRLSCLMIDRSLLTKDSQKLVPLRVAIELWKIFSPDDLKDNFCVVANLFEITKT